MKKGMDTLLRVVKYVVLIAYAVTCIYPMVWLLLSSLKTNEELFSNTWGLPESFRIGNYVSAIIQGHIGRFFFFSVIISVVAVFVCGAMCCMVSYAFARL